MGDKNPGLFGLEKNPYNYNFLSGPDLKISVLLLDVPRASSSIAKITSLCTYGDGVIEISKIQDEVILRWAIYHYNRCQVEV